MPTPTDMSTIRLALSIDRDLARGYAEYREDCRKYGRSHCEHGMYLLVDWDPICGPCEEGYSYGDPVFRRRMALDRAANYVTDLKAVIDAYTALKKLNLDMTFDSPRAIKAINARYGF